MSVRYSTLENWKERRQDKKTEEYWRRREEKFGLSCWEKYQQKWNFIETSYSDEPSNNGLDLMNPSFVFDKKLVKYLVAKECEIVDGKIIEGSIRRLND